MVVNIFIKVLLPAPLGPISAKTSPAAMLKRDMVDRDQIAEAASQFGRLDDGGRLPLTGVDLGRWGGTVHVDPVLGGGASQSSTHARRGRRGSRLPSFLEDLIRLSRREANEYHSGR